MNWVTIVKTAIRLYKWRLLMLALALSIVLIVRGNVTVKAAQLPPGSGPTPDIDPL